MAAGAIFSMILNESKEIIKNLLSGVTYMATHEVEVGIPKEANTAHANGMGSAELLYLHENGVPSHNIPPRPVLGPAMAQPAVRRAYNSEIRKATFKAVVTGNANAAEQHLHKAGMIGRDACKKYIADGTKLAPNAPATIARKGSSKPLIDTGLMMNSITYAVKEK